MILPDIGNDSISSKLFRKLIEYDFGIIIVGKISINGCKYKNYYNNNDENSKNDNNNNINNNKRTEKKKKTA